MIAIKETSSHKKTLRKRRLIPLLVGVISATIAVSTWWWPWVTEKNAIALVSLDAAIVFGCKSGVFWWMRRRMYVWGGEFTSFGETLVDFLGSLVILALTVMEFFVLVAIYTWRNDSQPAWLRLGERVQLVGVGSFVLAISIAVLYEMSHSFDMEVRQNSGESG